MRWGLRLRDLPRDCGRKLGRRSRAANDLENEMLDYAVNRQPGSRLACQIELTESMNGLIVRIPKTQK